MTEKVCTIDGCNKKHRSKGYCQKHYRAYIKIKGKKISLGTYENVGDAIKARKTAEKEREKSHV